MMHCVNFEACGNPAKHGTKCHRCKHREQQGIPIDAPPLSGKKGEYRLLPVGERLGYSRAFLIDLLRMLPLDEREPGPEPFTARARARQKWVRKNNHKAKSRNRSPDRRREREITETLRSTMQ